MAPQVTKTEGFRLSSRHTTLFNPYWLEINAPSRLHGPSGIGTEADMTAASRSKPVSSTTSPTNIPVALSMSCRLQHLLLPHSACFDVEPAPGLQVMSSPIFVRESERQPDVG